MDVCGHGVGAALLSVSVLNTIRSESLTGVDFRRPDLVLSGLNRVFRMERQNNLFFSLWYGVLEVASRQLQFASGGHPPAFLLVPRTDAGFAIHSLRTESPAIGCLDEARYAAASATVPAESRLLVFSDGVYEILRDTGQVGTWQDFLAEFQSIAVQKLRPAERLQRALQIRGAPSLEDDFSCLELRFA